MYQGKFVFAQIMDSVPWKRFQTCVDRYRGDYNVQTFKCFDYFRVMAFAQLTYRESLRDIVACLNAIPEKMYHMGIRSGLSLNNLSNAGKQRDWRIFADFAQILIERARVLYGQDALPIEMNATVYALDSTTIDLCLSLFPWASFRRTKAAIKLHTLLNIQGDIPEFILISTGKLHDVNVLDHMVFQAGAFYVMDRGYLDFERLYKINQAKAFFVTRAKKNTQLTRRYSHLVDKTTGVQCDQTVVLSNADSFATYPEPFRRVRYYDEELGKRFVFLTNNMTLSSRLIADLYRSRWRVELFFKWIKQHLRIKTFYGMSENAVKSQIWIGVSVYLLVAILKKELGLEQSLHQILQIFSLTQFEKTPVFAMFQNNNYTSMNDDTPNQLTLFDL
jgi:transposase